VAVWDGANDTSQGVPVRVRAAFVASGPRRLLLSVDYSQIEMRVLAHCAGDEALLRVFSNAAAPPPAAAVASASATSAATAGPTAAGTGDIYAAMAARVFGLDASRVSTAQRNQVRRINQPALSSSLARTQAKVVVLGLVYGMGVAECALRLGLAEPAAARLRSDFLRAYPGT
jgi:DNA polymerase-1